MEDSHISTSSFEGLPKHGGILENVFSPVLTIAKFGSFLLLMFATVATSQN
jgi:hypothetical protein